MTDKQRKALYRDLIGVVEMYMESVTEELVGDLVESVADQSQEILSD